MMPTDPSPGFSLEAKRKRLQELLTARVSPAETSPHPFGEYVNPHLMAILETAKLDRCYVRGQQCWLWDQNHRRYADFTAAYGTLPFGFNPPKI